jgi:hypothetical protein
MAFKAISAQTDVNTMPGRNRDQVAGLRSPSGVWSGCEDPSPSDEHEDTIYPKTAPSRSRAAPHTHAPWYFLRPPFPMRPRPSAFLGSFVSVKRGRRPDPFPLSPVSYPTPPIEVEMSKRSICRDHPEFTHSPPSGSVGSGGVSCHPWEKEKCTSSKLQHIG